MEQSPRRSEFVANLIAHLQILGIGIGIIFFILFSLFAYTKYTYAPSFNYQDLLNNSTIIIRAYCGGSP